MSDVVVSEFITVDGVVEDPGGADRMNSIPRAVGAATSGSGDAAAARGA